MAAKGVDASTLPCSVVDVVNRALEQGWDSSWDILYQTSVVAQPPLMSSPSTNPTPTFGEMSLTDIESQLSLLRKAKELKVLQAEFGAIASGSGATGAAPDTVPVSDLTAAMQDALNEAQTALLGS